MLSCPQVRGAHVYLKLRITDGAGIHYTSEAPALIPGFIAVRITRSSVLWVCFVDRCVVRPSSICGI